MKVIIGLGNPGDKYQGTRHNIGFDVLDEFRLQHASEFDVFKVNSRFKSLVSEGIVGGEKIILLKPETFMNNSGLAVLSVYNFYNLDSKDLIIIHDESDMFIGRIKIKEGGKGVGHKGIASIYNALDSDNYLRILIGIRDKKNDVGRPALDFVLSKFPLESHVALRQTILKTISAIDLILKKESLEKIKSLYTGKN